MTLISSYKAGDRSKYATNWEDSRGRFIAEPASPSRTPFQRDRDRIIHAAAFRRLKQKTQVFVAHESDHYRTRLTHSLEVAQVARSVARWMGLDEDLAEALALAHDLGHPPFGHSGEDVLEECMTAFEGFDHNAQTLRVVTRLEERYPEFDGLNLSWEMLEGLVKHNGPLLTKGKTLAKLPAAFRDFEHLAALEIDQFAGPEAQVAALADDIAYNNHDIDDGVAAGLFTLDELGADIPLVGDVLVAVRADYPLISADRCRKEVVRRLIGIWIKDLVAESWGRLEASGVTNAAQIRGFSGPLMAFSDQHEAQHRELKAWLHARMYTHYRVNRMRSFAKRTIKDLFGIFMDEPDVLPPHWQAKLANQTKASQARIICDYISSMTDTFALDEHKRLFGAYR